MALPHTELMMVTPPEFDAKVPPRGDKCQARRVELYHTATPLLPGMLSARSVPAWRGGAAVRPQGTRLTAPASALALVPDR
jgi:hypothetical protein